MSSIGHPQAPEPPAPDPDWNQGGADAFPRETLSSMVSDAAEAEQRRERIQVWALGAGLMVLALGLPLERLWASEAMVAQAAGDGARGYGLVVPLASLLHHALGLSPERAMYLLAAISYGLLLPAVHRLLQAIAFPRGLCLAASLGVLLGPGLWLTATLPMGFLPGVLGATLLANTLFRHKQRTRQGYQWRASSFSLLAFMLGPENLLLIPAVALATSQHPAAKNQPRLMPAFSLLISMAVGVVVLMGGVGASSGSWSNLLETLLAGGSMDPAGKLGWLAWMPLYLGLGVLGVGTLLFGRRTAEESPPPSWVVPWCVAGLIPVLGGSLAHGPAAGFLVPMAAIGLADRMLRIQREERLVPLALGFLLIQSLLCAALTVGLTMTDPHTDFRRVTQQSLNPTDLVLSQDPSHSYLLRYRWGVRCAANPEDFEPAISAGDTVIFDDWSGGEAPPEASALGAAQVLTLTPKGLVPERP
jgi:hypothetical protein